MGIAYPIPSTVLSAYLAELIPISSPFIFRSAPPLLPGLMAASVWISPELLVPSSVEIVLFSALIHPEVTDCPSALPIATTCWPTIRSSELPICAILISLSVSSGISAFFTAITARSLSESVPLILALTASSRFRSPVSSAFSVSVSAFITSLPIKHTLKVDAPSTTWLLVAIKSSSSLSPTIIPEPVAALLYWREP